MSARPFAESEYIRDEHGNLDIDAMWLARIERDSAAALPQGYEITDGLIMARHQTGQFCDCEECTGPDLTGAYDQVAAIMAYEQGDLDEDETIELFAALVETGVAWQLQGSYGRTAMALIEADLIGARV